MKALRVRPHMPRRLGIYTLGHYMSLKGAFLKTLWNPLLQNYEKWELSELTLDSTEDISLIAQTLEGMRLTHDQILTGFFPLTERLDCLRRIRSEFHKNFDNLVQILCMELHKPLTLARAECERCLHTLDATISYGEELLANPALLSAEASGGIRG